MDDDFYLRKIHVIADDIYV